LYINTALPVLSPYFFETSNILIGGFVYTVAPACVFHFQRSFTIFIRVSHAAAALPSIFFLRPIVHTRFLTWNFFAFTRTAQYVRVLYYIYTTYPYIRSHTCTVNRSCKNISKPVVPRFSTYRPRTQLGQRTRIYIRIYYRLVDSFV